MSQAFSVSQKTVFTYGGYDKEHVPEQHGKGRLQRRVWADSQPCRHDMEHIRYRIRYRILYIVYDIVDIRYRIRYRIIRYRIRYRMRYRHKIYSACDKKVGKYIFPALVACNGMALKNDEKLNLRLIRLCSIVHQHPPERTRTQNLSLPNGTFPAMLKSPVG